MVDWNLAPEGEEWTYRLDDGDRCKVIYKGEKKVWVLTEYTQDKLVKNESLKPIKPRITKAQAWDILTDKNGEYYHTFNPWDKLLEVYEVIDD